VKRFKNSTIFLKEISSEYREGNEPFKEIRLFIGEIAPPLFRQLSDHFGGLVSVTFPRQARFRLLESYRNDPER
jgi:hypothetical protein